MTSVTVDLYLDIIVTNFTTKASWSAFKHVAQVLGREEFFSHYVAMVTVTMLGRIIRVDMENGGSIGRDRKTLFRSMLVEVSD
jgi:hypothetical protein